MGIQDLQNFFETHCQQACRPVDLLQIARGMAMKPPAGKRRGPNSFRLAVDAESCLDRLYGGYFSDWACGGQWNRMTNFLSNLVQACHNANMELVVFCNGALESQRLGEWNKTQRHYKGNITHVLKHVNNKATPPPKVWWLPPACLHSALRMALRQLGVPIHFTLEDHHQEVITFCRENFYHGILAQDADYAVFDPPRYFASQHLKLTYKGALETQEYVMDDVAKALDLHPQRIPLMATLLGTHLLPEEDLLEFYCKLCNVSSPAEAAKVPAVNKIKAVVTYVRGLETIDDLDAIGAKVFENPLGNIQDKISRFKQSVQYYFNGTQDGFLKTKPKAQSTTTAKQPGSYGSKNGGTKKATPKAASKDAEKASPVSAEGEPVSTASVDSAAESAASVSASGEPTGEVTQEADGADTPVEKAPSPETTEAAEDVPESKMAGLTLGQEAETSLATAGNDSPAPTTVAKPTPGGYSGKSNKPKIRQLKSKPPPEVLRVATERHRNGLMDPWVCQLLTKGELKISVSLEDEASRELPLSWETWRPVRQRVYAVLFDLHKHMAEYKKQLKNSDGQKGGLEKPQVTVKEWLIPASTTAGSGPQCDTVKAVTLDWTVPGIQRLWLGATQEDKGRRLKTFLGCMSCDVNGDDNLLVNTAYVPQQYMILCCVLRHMIQFCKNGMRILRRYELDAFLATAVSPLLHDVETMQEMKLPRITTRGMQLASLFMRGLEHAIFGNEAVGAPVPWHMCCPWLFFDGKLFHFKLLKVNNHTPLIDICDGHVDQVIRVERMRQAILQGINIDAAFAKPMLPLMQQPFGGHGPPMYHHNNVNYRPAGAPSGPPMRGPPHGGRMGGGPNRGGPGPGPGRGRGLLEFHPAGRGHVDNRGGQLQIAGVVVGNWGANQTGQANHRTHRGSLPPQVTSVGPRRGSSHAVVSTRAPRGRGIRTMNNSGRGITRTPAGPQPNRGWMRGVGGGRKTQGSHESGQKDMAKITLEQRNKNPSGGRGRGCTVETQDEGSMVVSVSELIKENVARGAPPPTQQDAMLGGSSQSRMHPSGMPPSSLPQQQQQQHQHQQTVNPQQSSQPPPQQQQQQQPTSSPHHYPSMELGPSLDVGGLGMHDGIGQVGSGMNLQMHAGMMAGGPVRPGGAAQAQFEDATTLAMKQAAAAMMSMGSHIAGGGPMGGNGPMGGAGGPLGGSGGPMGGAGGPMGGSGAPMGGAGGPMGGSGGPMAGNIPGSHPGHGHDLHHMNLNSMNGSMGHGPLQ